MTGMAMETEKGLGADETALALLSALVAAQEEGEGAVRAVLADILRTEECLVEEIRYDPAEVPVADEFATASARADGERVTLVARLPGDPARRSLLLFAHPDSEPISGASGWRRDPFTLVEDGGRLHGWGVADDLAGLAAGALGLIRAARAGNGLGEVIFVSAPSKRHARGIAAALHRGISADAALYLHPAESGAGLAEVKALSCGRLDFRIRVSGQPPRTSEPDHTAFAHLARNPLDNAILLHGALKALDAARGARVVHPALEAAAGRSTNILVSTLSCGDEGVSCRVASSAVLAGTVSFPPGEPMEAVIAEVEAALAEASAGDPWLSENPPRVEWLAGVSGAECPPENPFHRVVVDAVEALTGMRPSVNPLHTASDIRNPMVQKSIPTLGIGARCGDLAQNGHADEWVERQSYLAMVAVSAAIVVNWCGEVRERAL